MEKVAEFYIKEPKMTHLMLLFALTTFSFPTQPAKSTRYPVSQLVATAVENALFSTVTRTCDSSTCAAGATHFLSTSAATPLTRICL